MITAILYLLMPLTAGWAIWQKTLLVAPMMVVAMVWGVIPIVHRRFGRFISQAVALIVSLTGALASPGPAGAQGAAPHATRWEFNLPSGTLIPIGGQGRALKRGDHSAAQLAWRSRPTLAFTTTVGWTRSRDLATPGKRRVDIIMYDIGAEWRRAPLGAGVLTARPFMGVGAGGRTYDYRGIRAHATHTIAAYGAAGTELGDGRLRLRFEVRDYVSGFASPGDQHIGRTRHDALVMAGLRWVRQ
ncbi:MAG: hypothetical protein IT361_03065 [Gemmatimonadaceae bacterium]|nr:hypothetical protein [Gemmatimonadaceae bacterium]